MNASTLRRFPGDRFLSALLLAPAALLLLLVVAYPLGRLFHSGCSPA